MKIKDLRAGNLLNVKEPAIHWNGEQYKDTIFEVSEVNKRGVLFVGFSSLEEYGCLEPIKLTDQWLKEFGFSLMTDTTPYNYRIHKNKSFCYIRYGTFGTFENGVEKTFQGFNGLFIANKFVRVIKYVHELQNLYFGLTGEELILNVGIQGNEAKS